MSDGRWWNKLVKGWVPTSNGPGSAKEGGPLPVTTYILTGTATAGAASSLTDSSLLLATNEFKGALLHIVSGTGVGQRRIIASNTTTALTVSSAWATQPVAGSGYAVSPSTSVTISGLELNIGNVGLLSSDETEIDLPKALDANSHFKVGLHASDPGVTAINTQLGTTGVKVDPLTAADFASQADVQAVTTALVGLSPTFLDPIAITQGSAGRTTIKALVASNILRLHELVLKADAAGSVYIAYDDDGAGANEVKLTGDMPMAANGSIVIRFRLHTSGCLKTAAAKQLTLVSTTSKVFGHAIVSQHTS